MTNIKIAHVIRGLKCQKYVKCLDFSYVIHYNIDDKLLSTKTFLPFPLSSVKKLYFFLGDFVFLDVIKHCQNSNRIFCLHSVYNTVLFLNLVVSNR